MSTCLILSASNISKYYKFLLLLLLFTPLVLFTSMLADGFHLSLSDSKSPQVSRTRLRIIIIITIIYRDFYTSISWCFLIGVWMKASLLKSPGLVSGLLLLLLLLLLLFTEIFTPVLADAFSLEFEWKQVSSNIQNSLYSDRS